MDDEGSISIVSQREQKRLWNLTVALIIAGREEAVMN
jgi:hypothetical protein